MPSISHSELTKSQTNYVGQDPSLEADSRSASDHGRLMKEAAPWIKLCIFL
jgi:hypothetical protein